MIWVAAIGGALLVVAGLVIRSPAFIEFAAGLMSADGVLDDYTINQLTAIAFNLVCAGLLLPALAFFSPRILRFSPAGRIGVALALVSAVLVALLYLWVAYVSPYSAANLRSLPDEFQYAVPAINLIERGRLVMVINGEEFPPITPFGFQLILVPFYRIFGTMIGNGIRAAQAGGVLCLVALYFLCRKLVGRKRALLALLLLCSNTLFIFWSEGIIHTTWRLSLVTFSLLLLIKIWRAGSKASVGFFSALLGIVMGAQGLLSLASVYVVPVYFVVLFYVLKKRRAAVAVPLLLCISAAFITILPLLVYNNATYGSPLRTGYHAWYWASATGESLRIPFSFARRAYDVILLDGLTKLGVDARVNGMAGRILDFAGMGKLYNFAVLCLFLIGVGRRWRAGMSQEMKIALLFLGIFVAINIPAYAFVAFSQPRYFLPALPVVLAISADGFCSSFEEIRGRRASLKKLALCVLLAFSLSSFGGLVGQRIRRQRPTTPHRYELACAYGELAGERAVIVSGISGAYLCHFLPETESVIWLPVSPNVRLSHKEGRLLFPVASENIGMLQEYLDRGVPIYIDDLREARYREEYGKIRRAFKMERVRKIGGHSIYRLHRRPSPGSG